MSIFIAAVRYFLIFIVAVCIASLFQVPLTHLYKYIFPNEIGGGFDIDFTGVVVLSYAIEFLLPFLILAFGGKSRYLIAGVIVILLVILEFFIDRFNLQVPIVLLISGIVLGWLIRFIAANTIGKMPIFEPYKKYF